MNDDFLHNQLIKLGDMMGDGLHHEPDGKWIEKEYARIFNALYPEVKKERRLKKNQKVNEQIAKLIETSSCKECSGSLRQSRSGSIVMYCTSCNMRYKAIKSKGKPKT